VNVEITGLGLTALGLAAIGCFSLPTLIGLWLSKSRWHWVLQALVIFAIASPLMLIRAFDLMLIVLVNAFLVLICSRLWRRWQRGISETSDDSAENPWFQLRIQDGLAAFVLLAIIAAMLAQAYKVGALAGHTSSYLPEVLQCLSIGAAAAIWGTSLLALRVLKFRFWLPWLILLAASAVAAGWGLFIARKISQGWTFISSNDLFAFLSAPTVTKTVSVLGWSITLAISGLTVTLIVWLTHDRATQDVTTKPDCDPLIGINRMSTIKKMLGNALLVLLISSIGFFYYQLMPPPAYSPIRKMFPGETNSYLDLVAAGNDLAVSNSPGLHGGWPPVSPGPTLAREIQANSNFFDDVKLLLQAPNYLSYDWDANQFDLGQISDDSVSFRGICRALSARSLQALSEGRHDDVVEDGLLNLKLAEGVALDGNYILSMVGTACEGIGITTTASGVQGASDEQLKKAAIQIDKMTDLFGPVDVEFERLMAADLYFMSKAKSIYWLELLVFPFMNNSSVQNSIQMSLIRRNVLRDLLRTEIAIKLYESEFGRPPESLKSLVPDFLPHVPIDGYSQLKKQPFHYRVSDSRETYQLYSVGGDGDDDDGETSSRYMDEGDLDLREYCGNRLAEKAKEVADYEAEQAEIAREQKEWEELDGSDDELWEENLLEQPIDDQ